jgi:DNA-binding transcriptional LysR family regulator
LAAINHVAARCIAVPERTPGYALEIQCDFSDRLIEALALGELDVVLAVTTGRVDIDPVQIWCDSPVWIAGSNVSLDKDGSVPLLVHPEGSPFRKRMIDALKLVDRQWQIVYQSPALWGIITPWHQISG